MEWKYVIPLINEENIIKVEKEYKIKLPEVLKEIIKKNNAGYPKKEIFDTEKEKERVFKNLLSYNKDDQENIFEYSNFFDKGLIPFALDPSGNVLCIDENKAIVFYLIEINEKELVANSFEEFLKKLY